MTDNESHKCTACQCEYTDDEGGGGAFRGTLVSSTCHFALRALRPSWTWPSSAGESRSPASTAVGRFHTSK
jgi:hypothetical protein